MLFTMPIIKGMEMIQGALITLTFAAMGVHLAAIASGLFIIKKYETFLQ